MTLCPDCRLMDLTEWVEDVETIKPPIWWWLPKWLWTPGEFRLRTWLCTRCGWLMRRRVDDAAVP